MDEQYMKREQKREKKFYPSSVGAHSYVCFTFQWRSETKSIFEVSDKVFLLLNKQW